MGFQRCSKRFHRRLDPNLTWHFNGSRNRKSHGIGVQLVVRFVAFLNVWEIGGVKKKGVVCRIYNKMMNT